MSSRDPTLWLERFRAPEPIRAEARLHAYACVEAEGGEPRVVLTGAPGSDAGRVTETLDGLARAHAAVRHPLVPPVCGRGTTGDLIWLALACDAVTDVETLQRALVRQDAERLPYAQANALFDEVCVAVAAAHDLPPAAGGPFYLARTSFAAVLVGPGGRPWLLGLGRPADGGAWLVAASAEYSAPEIKAGLAATPASDVHAIMTLFLSAMSQVALPATIAELLAGTDERAAELSTLLNRAVSVRPADRPSSLEELRRLHHRFWSALDVVPDGAGLRRFLAGRVAELAADEAPTATAGAGLRGGTLLAGRYELRRLLGEGGMGKVYLAWDCQLRHLVTVKQLHERGGVPWQERFRREIRIARGARGPHLVRGYDCLDEGGVLYAVMEYVEGVRLDEHVRRHVVSPAGRLRLLAQVASGLTALHEVGVVHRDIKPSNVLVDPARGAVLVDYGVAQERGSELTRTGEVLGTWRYMSPEQARGEPVDPASDVYALGLLCAELLGAGADLATLPPPARELVTACLDADPACRPPAAEVARLLGELAQASDGPR
jgi:predicted Ser/Thr protein kinase